MSRAYTTSKGSGDRIAHEVIQRLPIEHVGDATAEWYDARVTSAIGPGDVTLANVVHVEAGTPVEVKAARVRQGSGKRGRFYVREGQHNRLLEAGAVYALAVYAPTRGPGAEPIRALSIIPASALDDLIPSWIIPGGDAAGRCTYGQLAWSQVIDPAGVEEERRDSA